jgi:serine/threonine-protein kinase
LASRYELGALLGSGGAASVYRAVDRRAAELRAAESEDGDSRAPGSRGLAASTALREVAVKIIPHSDGARETFERFRQEALSLSQLRSRHIARVHDFGRDPELGFYLVMELVDGLPLDVAHLGRNLVPHEVLRAARGVLAALAEAHGAGFVHRDIKPSNVLVPRGRNGLDDVRVLDFGIARSARRAEVLEGLGQSETQQGVVLGTPAFMAPEQLLDEAVGPPADIYAAGLMLFELLGVGPLFPAPSLREQIRARTQGDPDVLGRVPPPLGPLLDRMLARDPRQRFQTGAAALSAVVDLDTAPVHLASILSGDASPRPSSRPPGPPPELVRTLDDVGGAARAEARRQTTRSGPLATGATPAGAGEGGRPSASRFAPGRPSSGALRARPRSSSMSSAFGTKRLCRLDDDPMVALRESLDALDIPMIDALGRRERGDDAGRMARALALALRLELDAAALVIEPVMRRSDVAKAIGASILLPRARRATRLRMDVDATDGWVDTIDAELSAMFASLSAALTGRDLAARVETRCKRALVRLGELGEGDALASSLAVTLRMGLLTAGWLAGCVATSVALSSMMALRDGDKETESAFHVLSRSLMLGAVAFRGDEHVARTELERASRMAADTGNTLLEARAMVAWGGMLVEIPSRVEQGLAILERATTLLAHGDAPGLEHIAEHNRGAALIIQQRFAEGAHHLARAREAAKGELSLEHEMISCTDEVFAHVFLGEADAARVVLEDLSPARISAVSARTAGLARVARSLFALTQQDLEGAQTELDSAFRHATEAEADGGDLSFIAELLAILYARARDEGVDLLARAGQLERLAQERGLSSTYWFKNLHEVVRQLHDEDARRRVEDGLGRLTVMLVPHEGDGASAPRLPDASSHATPRATAPARSANAPPGSSGAGRASVRPASSLAASATFPLPPPPRFGMLPP